MAMASSSEVPTITISVPTLIKAASATAVGVVSLGVLLFRRYHESSSSADSGDSDTESVDSIDLTDSARSRMQSLKAGLLEECKLVLLVRTDLKMAKGKIAAQCSHATLACYKSLVVSNPKLVKHWEKIGQAKVALKCSSEEEMNELEKKAKAVGLCAKSIRDAGRTQIAAGSKTVLGIGPGPVGLVDSITGELCVCGSE